MKIKLGMWVGASVVAFACINGCGGSPKTDVQDPSATNPSGTGPANASTDPSTTATNPGDPASSPAPAPSK